MGFLPPHKNTKKSEKPLLAQILGLIPNHILKDSIRIHQSDKGCSAYKTYDQLVCLLQYKALQYVANDIKIVVKKSRDYDVANLDKAQLKMNFNTS